MRISSGIIACLGGWYFLYSINVIINNIKILNLNFSLFLLWQWLMAIKSIWNLNSSLSCCAYGTKFPDYHSPPVAIISRSTYVLLAAFIIDTELMYVRLCWLASTGRVHVSESISERCFVLAACSPVSWGCRINQLHFCRRVRPAQLVSWIWY